MRLKKFVVRGIDGLEFIEAGDLSDVVVLAGPNGVGKTRVLNQLVQLFRNPRVDENMGAIVEATSSLEARNWNKRTLDTRAGDDYALLKSSLQKPQRRRKYRSTVLNFESNRSITQIKPFDFSWDIRDPYEEDVGWDLSYNRLRDRFTDVQHSLFRLVESQRRKIAEIAVNLKSSGQQSMPLDFPDPLEQFKSTFSQLLAPKVLKGVDLKRQQLIYEFEGKEFQFPNLSSGEREVVNIAFDFLLRNPSDCIVFFDEPELHLHPELSYKLLRTLSSIGENNQFIFCTHSPEIITASIENSVIFLTPKKGDGSNQALIVGRDDSTHHALNLLGQSIGVISLGKKLLLIEGEDASLDKQTYGAILKNEFPDLVLVPVGGKRSIQSFEEVRRSVLNKTIWGVQFFMLCDRDAMNEIGPESVESNLSERLRLLPRYHLENYFLDEQILAAVFSEMEPEDTWLCSADQVSDRLRLLAKQTVPLAVALNVSAWARETVGNIDVMPKGISQDSTLQQLVADLAKNAQLEQERIKRRLNLSDLHAVASKRYDDLTSSIEAGTHDWKVEIPGKIVLNRFAAAARLNVGRLKSLYIRHAQSASRDPFDEIRQIFRHFRSVE